MDSIHLWHEHHGLPGRRIVLLAVLAENRRCAVRRLQPRHSCSLRSTSSSIRWKRPHPASHDWAFFFRLAGFGLLIFAVLRKNLK